MCQLTKKMYILKLHYQQNCRKYIISFHYIAHPKNFRFRFRSCHTNYPTRTHVIKRPDIKFWRIWAQRIFCSAIVWYQSKIKSLLKKTPSNQRPSVQARRRWMYHGKYSMSMLATLECLEVSSRWCQDIFKVWLFHCACI